MNSSTGTSQLAIENYILRTYEGTVVSRHHLKRAIDDAITTNLISRVAHHKNSYRIKSRTSSSSSSRPAPSRTSRTSRTAASTAPPGHQQLAVRIAVGPVVSKKFEYQLNAKGFGLFVSPTHCYAADETGLVAQLTLDGALESLFKLSHGVKCLVLDDGFFFAGCNNGALYDLTSGTPRLVTQLEDFSSLYWIDICKGRTAVSDGSGNVAMVNCEGETEWRHKSAGEEGWMVRVDESGVYHGHSAGVTKYTHTGELVWHCDTAPVLFGWQEESHVFAALVEPGCFDGEIAKRLRREGAKTGQIVVSLMWNTQDDLDLSVECACGSMLWFGNKSCACGGELDVDMNTFMTMSSEPVENIFWAHAQAGKYKIKVTHFTNRSLQSETPFQVFVKILDQVKKFDMAVQPSSTVQVFEFDFDTTTTTNASANTNTSSSSNTVPVHTAVVKIDKATGQVESVFPTESSVPSVTCSEDAVFAAVKDSIKCFSKSDGSLKWHLWTDAGNAMSMQYANGLLFAVCSDRLVCMDVSHSAVSAALSGHGEQGRRLKRDRTLPETTELNDADLEAATAGDGVLVECVKEGSKIRVRAASGQNYRTTYNIQFPRNLRTVGARFVVDKLVLAGTFYRVQGNIRRLAA